MSDVANEAFINKEESIAEGAIYPDCERAKGLGFTPDLFEGYLWDSGDYVTISLIISLEPNKGNCQRLIKRLLEEWDEVRVPTPTGYMVHICKKMGCHAYMDEGTFIVVIRNLEKKSSSVVVNSNKGK